MRTNLEHRQLRERARVRMREPLLVGRTMTAGSPAP